MQFICLRHDVWLLTTWYNNQGLNGMFVFSLMKRPVMVVRLSAHEIIDIINLDGSWLSGWLVKNCIVFATSSDWSRSSSFRLSFANHYRGFLTDIRCSEDAIWSWILLPEWQIWLKNAMISGEGWFVHSAEVDKCRLFGSAECFCVVVWVAL